MLENVGVVARMEAMAVTQHAKLWAPRARWREGRETDRRYSRFSSRQETRCLRFGVPESLTPKLKT
jgi:hypothetical protein